jgi:predicted FMN-binding regulatory protein PaiB
MFVRPSWLPQSQNDVQDLITQNSWGLLVSNGDEGPNATNLPFIFDPTRGEKGVLTSHLSRANAHAAALQRLTEPALTVFHGPSSYITASWYPGRDMPPTVYYSAVHCYGPLVFQDQAQLRGGDSHYAQRRICAQWMEHRRDPSAGCASQTPCYPRVRATHRTAGGEVQTWTGRAEARCNGRCRAPVEVIESARSGIGCDGVQI